MPYIQLMRFDKPIGILLTLWPCLWAVWIAGNHQPSLKVLIIFIFGAIIMRAAGCVINDIADRHFDKHVSRTANRPLTSGQLSMLQACITFFVLMLIALILVLMLNRYTLIIAGFAAALTIIYPFCKRVTHLPQLILGIVFNSGILMAFAAQTNHVPLVAWILYLSTIIWTIAYDTQYALNDINDDKKLGLKSTAILFGNQAPIMIGILQGLFLLGLVTCGLILALNSYFWFTLPIVIGFFVYQHYLMKTQRPFDAFINNQWVGLIILLGILAA